MNEPVKAARISGNWIAIPFGILAVLMVIGVIRVIYLTNFAEIPEGITPPADYEPAGED